MADVARTLIAQTRLRVGDLVRARIMKSFVAGVAVNAIGAGMVDLNKEWSANSSSWVTVV